MRLSKGKLMLPVPFKILQWPIAQGYANFQRNGMDESYKIVIHSFFIWEICMSLSAVQQDMHTIV